MCFSVFFYQLHGNPAMLNYFSFLGEFEIAKNDDSQPPGFKLHEFLSVNKLNTLYKWSTSPRKC